MNKTSISIVIPVWNEQDNIKNLASEITEVMDKSAYDWECIWIDDMSADETRNELIVLNNETDHHRFIFLDRHYGQSAALAAGFKEAKADIVATIDGDGQNAPEYIPVLTDILLKNSADMVNGWRIKRADNGLKKNSSKIANGFRNFLTGENIRDVGCSLRVFKRECTLQIPVFKGMHRFFPTLVKISGFDKIIEYPVQHRPRIKGETKYGINNRIWVGIIDTLAVCWMKKRMVNFKIYAGSRKNMASEFKCEEKKL